MNRDYAEISVAGRFRRVRAISVNDKIVVITGRWIKTASVKDEIWIAGSIVSDPDQIIKRLKQEEPKADIFHFLQKLPAINPAFSYPFELYNVAAIPITSFDDWWEGRLSQVTRKNVRRAYRRGLVVQRMDHNDDLIKRIVAINNETPIRQGRRFWHYDKNFEQVKKDYSDFLDRSEFLGVFYDHELIGFLRLIYMGEIASILQLLCMNKHYDKRPANALIAKAVELCSEKALQYLVYGQYVYGDNTESPLTEFKRRNGFEKYMLPSYYVPLTIKGQVAITLNMHLGIRRWIPKRVMKLVRKLRTRIYEHDRGTIIADER